MIPFPAIPTVADGQALSAVTLNSYTRACRWLLGKSHEPYLANGVFGYLAYDSWTELYRGWALHYADTLYYDMHISTWYGGTWHVEVQYWGTDDNWHTVVDLYTSTDERYANTVDLSSESYLAADKLHLWRVIALSEAGAGNPVVVSVRRLAIRNALTISSWPTFTNAAPSAAADFNELRTNLNAIRDYLPPAEALACELGETTVGLGSWTQVGRTRYIRYRPESLTVGLQVRSASYNYQWRVVITDESDVATTIHTSGSYGWHSDRWDAYEETIDISAYASLGDYLRVSVQVFTASGHVIARRPYAFRESDQTPAAAWPTLPTWEHGDTDIGETGLGVLVDAGEELYSGDEELWSEVRFAYRDTLALWGSPIHMGLHKRRWLTYLPRDGETPTLRYGTTFARDETVSLPNDGEEWHNYDLASVPHLAPGQPYNVEGCHSAFESDDVLESI
jgi:hypothetical protein